MGLGEVTRAGVLAAVEECRYLGRDTFLRKYGFRRAKTYELVLDGGRYDSKAIVGVGHRYSVGTLLTADDFSGGAHTVARRLRALGFSVEEGASASEESEPFVPQLVLQPRGGARVRGPQNFVKSVRQGVSISDLQEVLGEQVGVLNSLYPDGVARLWGSTPTSQVSNEKAKALKGRRVGDEVLFYAENGFIARARILHLFNSSPVARTVWGTDEDNATWEHIMALGDVEEFPSSIRAAPILQSLGVPAPLRSLTLRSAEDYRRVAHLLPARRPSPLRRPSSAPPAAPAPMTAEELLGRFGSLNTHRSVKAGSPSRHQPLALLWAISRVVADEPRLAPWSQFRTEVGPLLAEFGLPSSKVTPEYPFWHLRRSGLWEVHGALDDAGAMPQIKVFDSVQPVAGLTCEAAELLRDPVTRLDAITKLCSVYLKGVDQHALLDRVGLAGYETVEGFFDGAEDGSGQEVGPVERASGPAERKESTAFRPVRDVALVRRVKELYRNTCQVCGTRLLFKRRPYSQAAHIRGLGTPHDGPDELPNLLCLCPNHHVLFDGLEIYIDTDGIVQWTHGGEPLGRLHRHPSHPIDEGHLRYHRTLCTLNA
ncbi:HNH endonuclease [Streptomyces sp. NHF165]|uniref:HNH endonuclease n=1 Tax=Streptomyces sp. NHF165 TaxID=2175864 RepID=UPI001F2D5C57|nr:HNH endonuclease [Streptomyces sp. NHF165]